MRDDRSVARLHALKKGDAGTISITAPRKPVMQIERVPALAIAVRVSASGANLHFQDCRYAQFPDAHLTLHGSSLLKVDWRDLT